MPTRDLPPSVPASTFRVFEPLEAFPAGRREALAARGAGPAAGQEAGPAERRAAWRRVLGRPPEPEPVPARILRVEGAVLFCPAWVEPEGRAAAVPAPVGDGSAGEATPERSAGSRRAGRRTAGGDAGAREHLLLRAWELPTAWLAVVRAEDLTRSGGPGRYVAPMSRARARAARALRTLRSTLGPVGVTLEAEELARWLEQFHPRSWIELDTRAVAALVDGDDGADDVRLGLESLAEGDATSVAAAYRRLRQRSHRLEQLSVSS